MHALIYIATFIPIFIYLIIGLNRKSRPQTLDDYFVYGQTVSPKDFANTSVGYALQMAAIFLFVDWGIRYGVGAFWVPLFWAGGYYLLYLLLPKLPNFLSKNWTIHGFLRSRSNSKWLQFIAAAATIIGLWGTLMVEIDYTTAIYSSQFPSTIAQIALGCAFLLFSLIYITYGGYKAEVNTSRIQVPVAYIALLFTILILITQTLFAGYRAEFFILAFGFLALNAGLFFAKVIGTRTPFQDKQIFIPITFGTAVVVILALLPAEAHTAGLLLGQERLTDGSLSQVKAQGLIGLISLFVSNVLWQFVDVSSWQRLSSVERQENSAPNLPAIRKGLLRTMVESPIS